MVVSIFDALQERMGWWLDLLLDIEKLVLPQIEGRWLARVSIEKEL